MVDVRLQVRGQECLVLIKSTKEELQRIAGNVLKMNLFSDSYARVNARDGYLGRLYPHHVTLYPGTAEDIALVTWPRMLSGTSTESGQVTKRLIPGG
jgi:hypothetical protein